jgi:hypothetical protein
VKAEVREVATTKSNQVRARLESERKRIQEELVQLSTTHALDERREGAARKEEATESGAGEETGFGEPFKELAG